MPCHVRCDINIQLVARQKLLGLSQRAKVAACPQRHLRIPSCSPSDSCSSKRQASNPPPAVSHAHARPQNQKHLKNRLPPGMAPEPASEPNKPLTAAQKKNQARAAARKAKKVAERAACVGDDDNDDQDGVETAAKALGGLKVSAGGGGAPGEKTASEPVDSARKVPCDAFLLFDHPQHWPRSQSTHPGPLSCAVDVGDIFGGLGLTKATYSCCRALVDIVRVVRGAFFIVAKPLYTACMLPRAKALDSSVHPPRVPRLAPP